MVTLVSHEGVIALPARCLKSGNHYFKPAMKCLACDLKVLCGGHEPPQTKELKVYRYRTAKSLEYVLGFADPFSEDCHWADGWDKYLAIFCCPIKGELDFWRGA